MILTTIDGMPLYSTSPEAVAHAIRIGLQGYHTHVFRGRIGYMAGVSHNSITNNTSSTQAVITPTPNPVAQQNISTTSSSSGGSGGGY